MDTFATDPTALGSVARPDDEVEAFRWAAHRWLAHDPSAPETIPPSTSVPATMPAGDVVRRHLRGLIESVLFASDRPMSEGEVARAAKADKKMVKGLLAELVDFYQDRGFRLTEVAGGYAFRTSPGFAPFVRDLAAKKPVRMSRAQIETLAILAYRQPITRPEIDDVRGVDSGAVLKALLERGLVRMLGKRDEAGRPIIYGTTAAFLEFFGLKSLADLPTLREFTELTDESKMTFQRETGEEALDVGGFAGGEGAFGASTLGVGEGEAEKEKPSREDYEHDASEDDVAAEVADGAPAAVGDEGEATDGSDDEDDEDDSDDDDDSEDDDEDDEDDDDHDDSDDDDDDDDDEDDDEDDDDDDDGAAKEDDGAAKEDDGAAKEDDGAAKEDDGGTADEDETEPEGDAEKDDEPPKA